MELSSGLITGSATSVTFVIWPYGSERQKDFPEYLNNILCNVKFTMETERWSSTFSGYLHLQKTGWLFGSHGMQEASPNYPLSHAKSHHHPANK